MTRAVLVRSFVDTPAFRAARTEAWTARRERVSYTQTSALLTGWKKTEELAYLNEVSSVPLQLSTLCTRVYWFADDADTILHWRESPGGQHIELGIAETNLVGLIGELGTTWSRWGQPLLPIGVLYDPFVSRALEPGRSASTPADSPFWSAPRPA